MEGSKISWGLLLLLASCAPQLSNVIDHFPFAYGERLRFPLVEGEFVSVEFHVSTPIPEWGDKTWYSRFEENARQASSGVEWLIPRQERLLLIGTEGGLESLHCREGAVRICK